MTADEVLAEVDALLAYGWPVPDVLGAVGRSSGSVRLLATRAEPARLDIVVLMKDHDARERRLLREALRCVV